MAMVSKYVYIAYPGSGITDRFGSSFRQRHAYSQSLRLGSIRLSATICEKTISATLLRMSCP
jgi:hypothetical protein